MNEIRDDRMMTELGPNADAQRFTRNLDLGQLADQLSLIAAQLRGEGTVDLRMLSGNPTSGTNARSVSGYGQMGDPTPPITMLDDPAQRRAAYAKFAREAYAIRRRRSTIFGNPELFGEPAWDILLDLYIAHAENKPVSVSSACIGSAAPPTTGLRWLGVLAEQELVLREHDPEDQRRVLVRLTEKGLNAMDDYFESAALSA